MWIQERAVVITILGYCCPAVVCRELTSLFRASVYAPPAGIVICRACVASGMPKLTLMVFGAIDLAGAISPGSPCALRSKVCNI